MIRFRIKDNKIQGEFPTVDPEMRKKMRRVFSGDEGEEVLAYILADLGFFDGAVEVDEKSGARTVLTGEEAVRANALRDYARRLLEQLGALHEGNAIELVQKMMQLPVWEKKKAQEE